VQHNGEREVSERLPLTEYTQAIPKVLDVGLLRLIHQHVTRVGLRRVVAELRHKACLRDVEVAAALGNFLAGLVLGQRNPLRANREAGRDLQQLIQYQRFRLDDAFFHRKDSNKMLADPQVVALCLDVGVRHLIVKELCALWTALDARRVVVEQATKECELVFLA